MTPFIDTTACVQSAQQHAQAALSQLQHDERLYHPGVRSHLTSALVQLEATVKLLDPANDQVKAAA